jgi:hypothetical protein
VLDNRYKANYRQALLRNCNRTPDIGGCGHDDRNGVMVVVTMATKTVIQFNSAL